MSAFLTLFEHERSDGFAATPRQLAALDRLNRAVGAEVLLPVLAGGRCEVQATQYVGVVRLGRRTIQVRPKVYRAAAPDGPGRVREATRNLLVLLSHTGTLLLHMHALASLLRREMDWLEVLTRLFATHLKDEWRRGPCRAYQAVEAELPVLKGKWRLAEQFRRPERQHHFAVLPDEFQADNALSRVFRFVVERLWRITRDAANRRLLGALRQALDEVTLLPAVTAAEAGESLLARPQRRFGPLLGLARLFLTGGALQLAPGRLTTFAFTFDMNRLFEEFVVDTVRRRREGLLPPELRDCELLPQAAGAVLPLARREGRGPAFRLRPDLLLRRHWGDCPFLLDTKYKRLDATQRDLGVSVADFHQMFSYAQRYHCPRVLLLYPQMAGDGPLRARFDLTEGGGRIEVATLDLCRDLTIAEGRRALEDELRSLLAGPERW